MARDGDMFTPEFFDALKTSPTRSSSCPASTAAACSRSSLPTCATPRWSRTASPPATSSPTTSRTTPEGLEQVRRNILKAGIVGRLVANDFSGAIISAELLEFDPTTGERLDFIAVSQELEEKVRRQFDAEHVAESSPVHPRHRLRQGGRRHRRGRPRVVLFFLDRVRLTGLLVYVYSQSHRLALRGPRLRRRGGRLAARPHAARLRHRPDVDPGAVPDLRHRRQPRRADGERGGAEIFDGADSLRSAARIASGACWCRAASRSSPTPSASSPSWSSRSR
jgi:hypothetical protein